MKILVTTFLELRRKLERATDSLGLILGRLIHMQDLKLRIYAKGAGLQFDDKAADKSDKKATCGCPVVKNGQDKTQNDNMEEDDSNRDYFDLSSIDESEFKENLQNCTMWQLEHHNLSDSAAWEHLQMLCNSAFDEIRKRANVIEKVADEAWVELPILTKYRRPEEKKKATLGGGSIAGRKRERDAKD